MGLWRRQRFPQPLSALSGPKTLCNACGVRRVRRNKGRGGQQPAEAPSPHARALPAHLRTSPSPEPWTGADSGADEAPFEPAVSRQYDTAMTNEPSPLGRRPQRKAAGALHLAVIHTSSTRAVLIRARTAASL